MQKILLPLAAARNGCLRPLRPDAKLCAVMRLEAEKPVLRPHRPRVDSAASHVAHVKAQSELTGMCLGHLRSCLAFVSFAEVPVIGLTSLLLPPRRYSLRWMSLCLFASRSSSALAEAELFSLTAA